MYGIAIDIGTTTVSGSLVELESRRELAAISLPNEQAAFGDDVISRLHLASKSDEHLARLQRSALDTVGNLIKAIVIASGINKQRVSRIVAVGNTAMHHLFLSLSPHGLARAPFQGVITDLISGPAEKFGLLFTPGAEFAFLPPIGGFVGSDAIAVILLVRMHRSDDMTLAVDIGTNGEIMLGWRKRIVVASTAAGPAFEGWHVSGGMRAEEGAISRVRLQNNAISVETIGSCPARGITGSGLLDLLAAMLKLGVIDRTGRLSGGTFKYLEAGGKEFFITQEDVRQLQLGKAAIRAGIEILMRELGITAAAVKHLYLAGAFGNYINKESAASIGLIPGAVELSRVEPLASGALEGAKQCLFSDHLRQDVAEVLSLSTHIELNKHPEFQNLFAAFMHF